MSLDLSSLLEGFDITAVLSGILELVMSLLGSLGLGA